MADKAENSRLDGDVQKAVKVNTQNSRDNADNGNAMQVKNEGSRIDNDTAKPVNERINNLNNGDLENFVKVKDDITLNDGSIEKDVTDKNDNRGTDGDIGENVIGKSDNSRIFGNIEGAVKVKDDISCTDCRTGKDVVKKADNSKPDGDTGNAEEANGNNKRAVKVKTDNSRIDGDIEKTVKVNLSSEVGEDEGVSDELYTNLYSWLCGAIQQERNHWKRQIDVTLQALNRHHKETLALQTKLQSLLSKLDPNAKQSSPNDLGDYNEENFEEKFVPSTDKLLEELETKLDVILDHCHHKGGSNSETQSSQTIQLPEQGFESRSKSGDTSVLLAESRREQNNGPHEHQYVEHLDNKGNNYVSNKMCSVPQETNETDSQHINDLKKDATVIIFKNDTKTPSENECPDHFSHAVGDLPSHSNVSECHNDQNEGGPTERSDSRSKPLKPEPQGKVVPISNCQVWSSVHQGANHNKPNTHPYLKRSSPAQPKETFSVKKLTSLSQEERQKYERAIQSKKNEIKYLKSDLEEAMDQIQKLQKVIQRLYILNRHLHETPRGVKDSSNTLKDMSTDENDPHRTNRDAPRNKQDTPTNLGADLQLSGGGKKTERKGISKTMPSLNNLPVFQALPGAEMALWKLRVKQRNIQGKRTEVAQCLRCQRLFRPSENNNISCRYHRNGQQTVEKYDTRGKLVKVVYKWACCHRDVDAPGCTHSQHI